MWDIARVIFWSNQVLAGDIIRQIALQKVPLLVYLEKITEPKPGITQPQKRMKYSKMTSEHAFVVEYFQP